MTLVLNEIADDYFYQTELYQSYQSMRKNNSKRNVMLSTRLTVFAIVFLLNKNFIIFYEHPHIYTSML